LKKALIVLELLLVALVAASLYLFVFVPTPHPRHADAIVVLSSNRERYDLGVRLYKQHVAPTLVLSLPRFPYKGGWDCPANALCFRADPYSTRGEAEAVARLARTHHWRTIVIVTSKYHVRRAHMLFARCTDSKLVFVPAHAPIASYVVNIPLELAKFAVQLTAQRHC
jgi:uncharacterized SAM-binding protein YcdF (DUF218 family)